MNFFKKIKGERGSGKSEAGWEAGARDSRPLAKPAQLLMPASWRPWLTTLPPYLWQSLLRWLGASRLHLGGCRGRAMCRPSKGEAGTGNSCPPASPAPLKSSDDLGAVEASRWPWHAAQLQLLGQRRLEEPWGRHNAAAWKPSAHLLVCLASSSQTLQAFALPRSSLAMPLRNNCRLPPTHCCLSLCFALPSQPSLPARKQGVRGCCLEDFTGAEMKTKNGTLVSVSGSQTDDALFFFPTHHCFGIAKCSHLKVPFLIIN